MANQQININLSAQEVYQALSDYPEAQNAIIELIEKAIRSQVKERLLDNLVDDATNQVLKQILPGEVEELRPEVKQAKRQLEPKRIQKPKRILKSER